MDSVLTLGQIVALGRSFGNEVSPLFSSYGRVGPRIEASTLEQNLLLL